MAEIISRYTSILLWHTDISQSHDSRQNTDKKFSRNMGGGGEGLRFWIRC